MKPIKIQCAECRKPGPIRWLNPSKQDHSACQRCYDAIVASKPHIPFGKRVIDKFGRNLKIKPSWTPWCDVILVYYDKFVRTSCGLPANFIEKDDDSVTFDLVQRRLFIERTEPETGEIIHREVMQRKV